ncbi:MAG: restriction endonuclease subunit S, partial [Muribaculaceae bacterium]|nr:restriction endonuclease subunit S [Muribaculaceae bacterium]
MELKKYILKEIATIWNGATPSSAHPEYYDGDIVWLTPKDLSDQKSKYIFNGERMISKEGFNSCSTHLLPKGTILMSSRAPIGLLAISGCECCTNQGFKNIIVDSKQCDAEFLFYYLKFNMKRIVGLGSGTTFLEVSKASLENFEIELPSLSRQQRIAHVLSSIDQKIALNREINRNLEAMARQLYDYWFVQFDFPD